MSANPTKPTDLVNTLRSVIAENADVVIPGDLVSGWTLIAGIWTATRQGTANYRLRRTVGGASESIAFRFYPRQRTTSSKGFKVTGAKLVYRVTTADVVDVTASGAFSIIPATGNAPAAATSLGTVTYDAAHDTSAERKAMGYHTMEITFGTPVYLNSEASVVEIVVVCDASTTATAVFDILAIELTGTECLVDAQ